MLGERSESVGGGAERTESVGRTESLDFSAFLPLTTAIKLVLKSKKY